MRQLLLLTCVVFGTLDVTCCKRAPIPIMSLPQCQCSDLKRCMRRKIEVVTECRHKAKCTQYLEEIGNSTKIRKCLDRDQERLIRLEACVKNKIMRCKNDVKPRMITVPVIGPENDQPNVLLLNSKVKNEEKDAKIRPNEKEANKKKEQKKKNDSYWLAELLAKYSLCVARCSQNAEHEQSVDDQTGDCALKLQCALAPHNGQLQKALEHCQKELNDDVRARFLQACHCMKNANVSGLRC